MDKTLVVFHPQVGDEIAVALCDTPWLAAQLIEELPGPKGHYSTRPLPVVNTARCVEYAVIAWSAR